MKKFSVFFIITYSIVSTVIGCLPEKPKKCYVRMSTTDSEDKEPAWKCKYHYIDQTTPTPVPVEPTTSRPPTTTTENYVGKKEPSTDAPDTDDPCKPYKPDLPDFNKPGRRISETKCYEYVWYLYKRLEVAKRKQECDTHIKRNMAYGPVSIPQILGGRGTVKGEFPHMGAIGWKGVTEDEAWLFKCGGTLISPKFLLTAAHCTKSTSRDTTISDVVPKIVRFGVENITTSRKLFSLPFPTDVHIKRIIPHPLYKPPKKYYDIALMELEHELDLSKDIQPACLWTKPEITVKEATVTGWGVTDVATQKTSSALQAANLDIIDSPTCDKLLENYCSRHWCGLQDHQLCAGKLTGGVDSCQGDSGGPLQVPIPLPTNKEGSMHRVIGVVSFGIGCGRENMPGVYVSVASVIDWIEGIVWN